MDPSKFPMQRLGGTKATISNFCGLYNAGIDAVTPACKAAVLLVITILLIGLTLRTSMAIDAVGIITLCFELQARVSERRYIGPKVETG